MGWGFPERSITSEIKNLGGFANFCGGTGAASCTWMVFSGVGLGSSAVALKQANALKLASHLPTWRILREFNLTSVRRHRAVVLRITDAPHRPPTLTPAQNYSAGLDLASDIPRHSGHHVADCRFNPRDYQWLVV